MREANKSLWYNKTWCLMTCVFPRCRYWTWLWTDPQPPNLPTGQRRHICGAALPLAGYLSLFPLTWKDTGCSRMLIYWNGIQPRPPDGWNGSGALTSISLWPVDFGPETLPTRVFIPVRVWTSDIHQSYLFLFIDSHTVCLVFIVFTFY